MVTVLTSCDCSFNLLGIYCHNVAAESGLMRDKNVRSHSSSDDVSLCREFSCFHKQVSKLQLSLNMKPEHLDSPLLAGCIITPPPLC